MKLALHLFVTASLWTVTLTSSAQTAECPLPWSAERVAPIEDEPEKKACLYHVTLPHLDYTRSFKLLVPDSYEPGPAHDRLVLDFHGYGSTKVNQFGISCWKNKAVREGFAVAYPNGTGFPTSFSAGDYCCNASPVRPPRNDVAFAKDVATLAKSLLNAGSTSFRVYVSGLSNGGAVAHNLACEATEDFDGIAAVSQTYAKRDTADCLNGKDPIPVLDFRATNDSVIPFDGGGSLATLFTMNWLSASESRDRWSETLGCNGELARKDYAGGSHCVRMDCPSDFVQCTIEGPYILYKRAAEHGVNVCDAAWEFFGEQETNVLP